MLQICTVGHQGKVKVRKQGQSTPKVVAEDLVYDYNKPIEHVYVFTLNL